MNIKIFKVTTPLKKEFIHAEKSRNSAESIILILNYLGIEAVGECAPRNYVTGETVDLVFKKLKTFDKIEFLKKLDKPSLELSIAEFMKFDLQTILSLPNAICAFELAVIDWIGKRFRVSASQILHQAYPEIAKINPSEKEYFQTTQVLDLSLATTEFLKTRGPFHFIKIKVNNCLNDNISRVKTIRDFLGPDVPIVLDANMAWTYEKAIQQIEALQPFQISYFEEPLRKGSYAEYANLRKKTGSKILLDESICSLTNAYDILQSGASDAWNIRIAKSGGFSSAMKLIQLARENNIKFQLGCQVAEVGPLLAAGRHLRNVTDDAFAYEAGQADRWFDTYLFSNIPLVNRDTNLADSLEGPGLGIGKFLLNQQGSL